MGGVRIRLGRSREGSLDVVGWLNGWERPGDVVGNGE